MIENDIIEDSNKIHKTLMELISKKVGLYKAMKRSSLSNGYYYDIFYHDELNYKYKTLAEICESNGFDFKQIESAALGRKIP